MRVGIIGTGAVAQKHAQAYANLGFQVVACTNIDLEAGRAFAHRYGCEFLPSYEEVCNHPHVDYVDVCTFPNFRLQPVQACAAAKKHVQVQKPIATNLETAQRMIDCAQSAGIQLGVVSQHRFDDSIQFLREAFAAGRLGPLIQADAYVKWYRSAAYYSRPIKGSWDTEGGGALINQAIHQVDLLLWLTGGMSEVMGHWHLGAVHKIESEDVVAAVVKYSSGAIGVIQASTAFWPGYNERLEFHGVKGTAVISGDKLTAWHVEGDHGAHPPLGGDPASGASDPMATPLAPFERQFRDFADAISTGRKPCSAGEDGFRALQAVLAIYESCRTGQVVRI
jgi:UDP-N-acetyl-2-amino-2-deoxyglucuronate dehydrogenase